MRRFAMGSGRGLFVFHLRKVGASTPEIKMSEILKTMDRAQQVINKRRDIFRVSIEPIQSRTCDVVFFLCLFIRLTSSSAKEIFGALRHICFTSKSHVTILINFRYAAKQKENMQLWIR